MKKLMIIPVVLVSCLGIAAEAAEKAGRTAIQPTDNMRTILAADVGKSVKLRLRSGNEVSGKITRVGNGIVQISEVSGMEFFDAIVNIDDISAMLIRVRNK